MVDLRAEEAARRSLIAKADGWIKEFSQFNSVTQSCPNLCYPMDCSTPGFPVQHQLLELAQTHVHWVSDTIQPSYPVFPFSCLQFFPASGSFPMSQFFASGVQSTGVSTSASVLSVNIHWKDWCWGWSSNMLTTWCEELTHWKRPWGCERLRAGEKGDDRG